MQSPLHLHSDYKDTTNKEVMQYPDTRTVSADSTHLRYHEPERSLRITRNCITRYPESDYQTYPENLAIVLMCHKKPYC